MSIKSEIAAYDKFYPLQKRRIEGVDFYYRYCRRGMTTIILLAGDSGRSDFLYRQFMTLAQEYSVLTFDYPAGYTSNKQLALAVSTLIKELGIGSVYLIGQSYGGFMAQIIAKYYPEVVRGLILSDTGCLAEKMNDSGRQCLRERLDKYRKDAVLLKFMPAVLLRSALRKELEAKADKVPQDKKEMLPELIDEMVDKTTSQGARHMCQLMAELENEWQMTPDDFKVYKGRVLLFLNDEDKTFDQGVKEALISMMSEPKIVTSVRLNYFTAMTNDQEYIETIASFISQD